MFMERFRNWLEPFVLMTEDTAVLTQMGQMSGKYV